MASARRNNDKKDSSQSTRKQQERSIRTQEKLLEAALQAFSENGFKGTSTRDIADRAGVHHPLITYHFKNKEELWRAAADRVFRRFNSELLQTLEHNSEKCAKTRMAAMIRAYVHYAAKHPALHKVIVQEASFSSARLDWLTKTHLRPLFKEAVVYIEQLQDLGVAPQGDPALLFNMIRVSSGGLLALAQEIKSTTNVDLDAPGAVDALADMIISVFLPGDMPENMRFA
ncbi:MAG: TetR family transcriptional regulator [Gammaproteobacteria bacterium]|nr:TetR family transcriptional regulator [Gammaproteobacteria bacterium]MDH4313858.1 TetR family transcriptional regulator [Gammaproteobacteria bacterium]MDH5215203.1 TetR family transcriptional regulator [Gammaproteobacteria bacterium]